MKKIIFSLFILFLIVCSNAYASLITMNFSGDVENVHETLEDVFDTNDAFSGWVTFESTTMDEWAADYRGDYNAIVDFSVTVGPYTATADEGYIRVYNNEMDERDFYSIFLYSPPAHGALIGDSVNDMPLYSFLLSLSDETMTALSSAELPTSLDVEDFDSGLLRLQFADGTFPGGSFFARSVQTSTFELSFSEGSAVPEPASMILFGLGAVGAFIRKRFA